LRRFIAVGPELPDDAVVGTGVMLSIRPKPGRIEAAAEATGAEGAAAGEVTTVDGGGEVTTVDGGGEAGGTTTMGAGCLLAHAPSNATATIDTGRIRNLLIVVSWCGNLA
jgi:hypothetical protein